MRKSVQSFALIGPLLASAALAAPPPAHATDEAYAKMMECLKLPAASAKQDACVSQVKAMTPVTPKAKSAPAAKPPAAPAVKATAAPVPDGGAKAKPAAAPPVPTEVKQAAAVLAVNGSGRSGAGGPAAVDISGMDLETAMMAVQSQRANLLESQLKDQLEAIQKRNDEIRKLNQLLAELRAQRPGGNDPAAWGALGRDRKAAESLLAALKAASLPMPTGADALKETGSPGMPSPSRHRSSSWPTRMTP